MLGTGDGESTATASPEGQASIQEDSLDPWSAGERSNSRRCCPAAAFLCVRCFNRKSRAAGGTRRGRKEGGASSGENEKGGERHRSAMYRGEGVPQDSMWSLGQRTMQWRLGERRAYSCNGL